MMRMTFSIMVAAAIGAMLPLTASRAQPQSKGRPTKVMVRVLARDAKVIGSHVGGARVTIRDVSTGAVLAQGIQQGGTGSTELIMTKPRNRGDKVYDLDGTAGFLATVMLEKPTVVQVIGEGPLGAPEARLRASKTMLLVPGQDVLGEGILLEIHGYIVKLVWPEDNAKFTLNQDIGVRATVNMA